MLTAIGKLTECEAVCWFIIFTKRANGIQITIKSQSDSDPWAYVCKIVVDFYVKRSRIIQAGIIHIRKDGILSDLSFDLFAIGIQTT